MSLSKKLILVFVIAIASTVAATFFYQKNHSGDWVAVRESKIIDAIYGLATLESDETFRYRVGITSQVKKLYVKEGESVRRGDLLIQLAEGALIRTPIDGVVTQLDTKESETVFPNINLITVMNLKKVALTITLEQSSAIRVQPSLPVKIQFESVKGIPLTGKVRSVYPKEGQFVIKVDLDSLPPSILPGMTADTAIVVGEKEKALLVPLKAIQRGMITIHDNGKSRKVAVKTGFQDLESIELLEVTGAPLQPGLEVWVSRK